MLLRTTVAATTKIHWNWNDFSLLSIDPLLAPSADGNARISMDLEVDCC